MSQIIWDVINPSTTSGNQLATLLNNFKDAVVSGLSGPSRPSETEAGGNWIDTAKGISHGTWDFKVYNGTVDIIIFTINNTTGQVVFPGGGDTFSITRLTEDAIAPLLKMVKKRTADNGQTKSGDIIGKLSASGHTDAGTEVEQSAIEVSVTEDTTASAQGTKMSFKTMKNGQAALAERMVIAGDQIGIGKQPEAPFDVAGESKVSQVSDDAVGPTLNITKKRINLNGQTLNNDILGRQYFNGVNEVGSEVAVASIEVISDEDTTAASRGCVLSIKAVAEGSSVLQEMIRIEKNVVTIAGVNQNTDTKTNQALAGGAGEALFAIDSTDYGAFKAELFITSFDSVEGGMGQTVVLSAVYSTADSAWQYTEEGSVLVGPGRSIELAFADAAGVLTVTYDNVMDNFSSGKIYTEVRRHEV